MKAYLRRLPSALGAVLTLATLAFASSGVAAQTAPVSMPGEIIVKVSLEASDSDVRQLAEKAKCNVVQAIPYCPNYYLFRLKSVAPGSNLKPLPPLADVVSGIATLKQEPKVSVAEPNYYVFKRDAGRQGAAQTGSKTASAAPLLRGKTRATQPPSSVTAIPNDPFWPRMWGMRAIRMPEAWAIQNGKVAAVVGVADSGIDSNHPDFKTADGTGTRILAARNFINDAGGTPDPNAINDLEGHGTHVAGTAAATTNNDTPTGVPSVAGWNRGNVTIKLKIARVLNNTGGGTAASIAAGINYLTDEGVDVINLSLGHSGNAAQIEADAVSRAIAANVTVVGANGNENADVGVIGDFPTQLPGVISVSAVGPDLTKASYSNYGGQVAITAPGGDGGGDEGIWSTWPTSLSTTGYESISGTSMACPHVAGAVALLIAVGAPRNPATIKSIIQQNAIPLDETPNFAGGNKYGAGLLDVYSAILPYSDPPFSIGLLGGSDRGQSYTQTIPPFQVQAVGVTHAPSPASITLEIQTATLPGSVVRTLIGGRDFTVPTTVPEGSPIATPVTFTIPGPGNPPLVLPPGRYKALLKLSGTVIGTQFFEIVARTQPIGRTMFATPFQIRQAAPVNPEQAHLGAATVFTLARYNPIRLPSDFDYALFQSNGEGRHDAAASFNATAPDGSPLVYQADNPATSIAPVGLGYWLNIDRAVTLSILGSEVTTPVSIRLFAGNNGWNMVGAPFTAPTAWAGVAVRTANQIYTMEEAIAAGVISPALIGYRDGDYVYEVYPLGTLQPFQAYWVRVYADCTLIVAPSSQTRAQAATRSALPPITGWRARLSAHVAGDRDGQNYFGQTQGAENGVDRYDVPKPPSGAGHAYVRFLTDTSAGRQVAQAFDMRSTAGNGKTEWTAAVSTDRTNADVTIGWDSLGNLPNRSGLILTDVATGKTVDMRSRSNYTYRSGEAGSTRQFRITMQPRLSAGPLVLQNVVVAGGGRSAQAGLSVRFSTNRDAEVTGVIKALNGTVVGNLTGSSRASATNQATLRWSGRTRSGDMAPPGPYLIEITARAADGSTAAFSQPVQNMQ